MISKYSFLLLVSVLIAGCVTPTPPRYDQQNFREEVGPGGLIKIRRFGQHAELIHQTQDYTLYYCAQVAQRQGSPYFALYQSLPDALRGLTSDEVKATTVLRFLHAEVYISLRNTAAPGLLSTAEVLTRLKPAIDKDLQ